MFWLLGVHEVMRLHTSPKHHYQQTLFGTMRMTTCVQTWSPGIGTKGLFRYRNKNYQLPEDS